MKNNTRAEILEKVHLIKKFSGTTQNTLSVTYAHTAHTMLSELENISFSWHDTQKKLNTNRIGSLLV